VLREPQYSHIHHILEDKTNFIVIGDGLGDAGMIDENNNRTILKVGLCNDKVEERLTTYQSKFDIVITHDE
jgi:Pyrimidine 5'-nucleotidase (UMPH-1)